MREGPIDRQRAGAQSQEQRIKQEEANLESASYDLNKLRIVAADLRHRHTPEHRGG